MGKAILTQVKVVVATVDLSRWAFEVEAPDAKEQIDVSGFNVNKTREYLPGLADQTITVRFLQDFAVGAVHQTLQPYYASGSAFPMYLLPDAALGTTATNPLFGGSANLYEYQGLGGALNARSEITAVFRPAPNSLFTWGTVAP